MITISVFNGLYCTAPQVIEELVNATGYRLVTDQDVIAKASMLSGIDASLLAGAFPTGEDNCGRTPDTGGAVGWLRLAMAHKLLERRDSIFHGYSALLLPQKMRHVLRVCLVSGIKERLMEGMRAGDCPSRELRDRIFADDMARADWAMSHTDCADPWDERFYDLVIPVSSLGARQSASRIMELLCKTASRLVGPYDESLDDFLLAATVQADLSHWGDCVSVVAKEGAVTLGFNDHAKALGGMIRDLRDIVSGIEGVESVHIGTGRSYNQADIHCRPKHWPTPGRRPDAALPEAAQGLPEDAALAARVRAVLSENGYPVSVHADNGSVSLTITDHSAMLELISRRLCDRVSRIDGVETSDAGIVGSYLQSPAYHAMRREKASRALLNDDREFSPYPPERLRERNDVSIAMYYGDSATGVPAARKPEVVLLDVDMPGLDGVEALRRVRQDNPGAKVLVLSGREREAHREMDAFAYIRKPVTTSVLGSAIRAAAAGVPATP